MPPNVTSSPVKMDKTEVGRVCEELDELFMKIMDDYDHLQSLYKKIAQNMSSGHINIAQTRHFKGPTTVGELQYPAVMVPLTKAQMYVLGEGFWKSRITKESDMNPTSSIRPTFYHFTTLETDFAPSQNQEAGGNDLRQRAGKANDLHKPLNAASEAVENASTEDKPAKKVKDPLRWFGVLVPSQLRQAQKDFKAATETALEMATVKAQLLVNMETYDKLMAQKQAAQSIEVTNAKNEL